MAKIHNIPVLQGKTPEEMTTIGTVRLKASDKQMENLYLGVLLPNYDIEADGSKTVSSYTIVARTQVLHPALIKKLAGKEMEGLAHYDQQRRDKESGAGEASPGNTDNGVKPRI